MDNRFSKRNREAIYKAEGEADCKVESCSERLKKRKISQVDWSTLLTDPMDLVLKRLSSYDKLMFKDTCRSWYSVAEKHTKPIITELQNRLPLLLMPTDFEEEENNKHLLDLVNKVQKPLKMPANSHCIGSSQGWLILLQDKQNILIYNQILDVKFQLPHILSFPEFNYNPVNLSRHWIRKVIMWCDSVCSKYLKVAVIYGSKSKIAYINHKTREWTLFEDSHNNYCDITVCKDYIYALSERGSVEAWRMDCQNPIKVENLSASLPLNISEDMALHFTRRYIVESNGEILQVIRCIADYVNPDGEPILEHDLVEEYRGEYLTKNFYVYKLDLVNKEWIELKDLGDRVLFVGGNHSKSLSANKYRGCKANSIYFTDDYWERIDEDYMYGGHDMGIFDFGDKNILEIYDCKLEYRMIPAFWIL